MHHYEGSVFAATCMDSYCYILSKPSEPTLVTQLLLPGQVLQLHDSLGAFTELTPVHQYLSYIKGVQKLDIVLYIKSNDSSSKEDNQASPGYHWPSLLSGHSAGSYSACCLSQPPRLFQQSCSPASPSWSVLFSVTGSCYTFPVRGISIFLSSDPDTQALKQSVIHPTEKLHAPNLVLYSESISVLDAIKLCGNPSFCHNCALSSVNSHSLLSSLPLRENTARMFFN